MNKTTSLEIPPWVVRSRIVKIYNREREKPESLPVKYKRNKNAWMSACLRALNKIEYRRTKFSLSQSESKEWQTVITYQIEKIKKRHDSLYLWSLCEFQNMEKLNIYELNFDETRNSIWLLKAIDEVSDIKKRINSKRRKLSRTENSSWTNIIRNIRLRLKLLTIQAESIQKGEWYLSYRYNAGKLRHMNAYVGWDSRIMQNQRKVKRWLKPCFCIESENIKGDNEHE